VSLLLHYYGKTSKRSKKKLKRPYTNLIFFLIEKKAQKAVPNSWAQDPYHFVVTGTRGDGTSETRHPIGVWLITGGLPRRRLKT
jgi:hypothetical protein